MNVTSPAGTTGTNPLSKLQSLLAQSGAAPGDAAARGSGPPNAAADPASDPKSLFEALAGRNDSDGDGLLSAAEFDAAGVSKALPELFSKVDSDGDGLWSEAEMASAQDKLQGFLAERSAAASPGAGDPQSLYQSVIDALMREDSAETDTTTSQSSDRERVGQFLDLLSKIG
ncbi:MAG: hypothetical protein IE922_06330 [Sphingomonadales bacterium]|nr:hypothetical protein [Sphingomonadales bacterium]